MQVDLYNGRKMVLVVAVLESEKCLLELHINMSVRSFLSHSVLLCCWLDERKRIWLVKNILCCLLQRCFLGTSKETS